MFTGKMTVASLSLVLFTILPAVIPHNLPYTTIVEKSVAGYKATSISSFSIPDNQCSGFIGESLLCGTGGVASSLRVEVRESTAFPTVRINRHLRNVTILRAQDVWGVCSGQAEVEVYVGCLVMPPQVQRRRRFISTLATASTAQTVLD